MILSKKTFLDYASETLFLKHAWQRAEGMTWLKTLILPWEKLTNITHDISWWDYDAVTTWWLGLSPFKLEMAPCSIEPRLKGHGVKAFWYNNDDNDDNVWFWINNFASMRTTQLLVFDEMKQCHRATREASMSPIIITRAIGSRSLPNCRSMLRTDSWQGMGFILLSILYWYISPSRLGRETSVPILMSSEAVILFLSSSTNETISRGPGIKRENRSLFLYAVWSSWHQVQYARQQGAKRSGIVAKLGSDGMCVGHISSPFYVHDAPHLGGKRISWSILRMPDFGWQMSNSCGDNQCQLHNFLCW